MNHYIYAGIPQSERIRFLEHSTHYIIDIVCKTLDVSIKDFTSTSRLREFVRARAIASYFLYKETSLSHSEIAEMLGKKDRTTVNHLLKVVENRQYDLHMLEAFKKVESKIIDASDNNDYQ